MRDDRLLLRAFPAPPARHFDAMERADLAAWHDGPQWTTRGLEMLGDILGQADPDALRHLLDMMVDGGSR